MRILRIRVPLQRPGHKLLFRRRPECPWSDGMHSGLALRLSPLGEHSRVILQRPEPELNMRLTGRCRKFGKQTQTSARRASLPAGAWIWIGVEDVEKLYEEFKASGVKIRRPPANYPWALEMQIEDPDGNVLRLGSDPKSDRPFEA